MNLQAIHNKAYKRARYIERGPAYKTHRKDRRPCPKDCACKLCDAYMLALQAVISPERFTALTAKK